jgi:hypothetical protein
VSPASIAAFIDVPTTVLLQRALTVTLVGVPIGAEVFAIVGTDPTLQGELQVAVSCFNSRPLHGPQSSVSSGAAGLPRSGVGCKLVNVSPIRRRLRLTCRNPFVLRYCHEARFNQAGDIPMLLR